MGREVKRVPLDFDAPLDKVWKGYINPHGDSCRGCESCEKTGLAPGALNLQKKWYGYVEFDPSETGSKPFPARHPIVWERARRNYPESNAVQVQREAIRLAALFNDGWNNHIDADDVRALVAHDRLRDFIPWCKDEVCEERVFTQPLRVRQDVYKAYQAKQEEWMKIDPASKVGVITFRIEATVEERELMVRSYVSEGFWPTK